MFPFDFLIKLNCNEYILFTLGVVSAGRLVCSDRLVCSVNVLYMELNYTGSLEWSTRASLSQFKLVVPVRLRLDIIDFLSLFN